MRSAVRIGCILIGVALELRLDGVKDLGLLLDVTEGSHPGSVAVEVVLGHGLCLLLLFVDVAKRTGPWGCTWISAI